MKLSALVLCLAACGGPAEPVLEPPCSPAPTQIVHCASRSASGDVVLVCADVAGPVVGCSTPARPGELPHNCAASCP